MAGNLDFRLNLLANTTGLQQGMDGAKFAVNALVAAMAAVGVGLSIRGLADAADSYANLSARIQQSTKENGDFEGAMAGVHQVALMTNSSLQSTGDLFTRLNTVGKEMGMTQQQALDITKTVTQAIQIGGGTAQQSEAAITQFIQAMQGGVLRGEEFNSMMENGYGLAEALAKGLGVTTGELRKMAENGELSSDRVVKALQSQAGQIQATYDKFPTTIGNALQRITTSWEGLIGKMDQSSGASATVAQWLVNIADNIGELDVVLEDIGEGFVWVGDQLKKIDPATIEAFKTALMSAYDALKSMASAVANGLEITFDQLNSILGAVFSFNSGVDAASDKTNGFTKVLQALNVVFGFISDGFNAIKIAANLLSGVVYDVAAAFTFWKSKLLFGDAKTKALQEYQELSDKAQSYYKNASDGAIEFKSKGVAAIQDISKTQEQKNADQIANSQKTLDELKAQEEKHRADYKSISDQRLQLEQQLHDARKSGNQAAIDEATRGLTELQGKEKEYQTEGKKITDEKIKAAEEWVVAQLTASDGTQKAADAATQKTLQTTLAAQGLKLEFDSTGKAVITAMDSGSQSVGKTSSALDKARMGAKDLGIDLDVALNRVSEKFSTGQKSLIAYAGGLEAMGIKGAQASQNVYSGWVKWLEKAKSPAEIDAAKAQLLAFEKQGVISTKQVEQGMQAVRQVVMKLPGDLDPVEQAFERLGIKTKAQLALAAQSALSDFNTIQASGQATAESIRQAYERTMQAAAASGDQAVIAATQAKAASLGLQVQVDSSGKTSVTSMNNLESSIRGVGNAFDGIRGHARSAGEIIRGEAQASSKAWESAAEAMHKTVTGSRAKMAYDAEAIKAKLVAQGYSDSKASQLANEIYESSKNGNGGYKQVGNNWSFAGGGGGMSNTEYVDQILAKYKGGPQTATIQSSSTRKIEITSGSQTSNLYGSANDVDSLESILSQFEAIKKSS